VSFGLMMWSRHNRESIFLYGIKIGRNRRGLGK
jgi:hypothetical protein